MKKRLATLLICGIMIFPTACGVKQADYDALQASNTSLESEKQILQEENEQLSKDKQQLTTEKDNLSSENEKISNDLKTQKTEFEKVTADYSAYKEKMKPYETLSVAEAEAKTAEAEQQKVAAEKAKKEQEEADAAAKAAAESEAAAAKAAAESEAAAAKAAEEAKGYESGITYDQLARTPDDYKGQKVKFSGKVLQVLEGDTEVDIRLATSGGYDNVIFAAYAKDLVTSRILEDDQITIYGTSLGLYSYESTMGGTITIPSIWIDKIDQ